MNKAELIGAVAEKTGLTKVQAKAAVEAIVESTAEALQQGDKVSLVGFGSFNVVRRAARKGRNPQTKKEMEIPAKNVVKFRPSAELSDSL
ncbi:MAG TPA: HU family DNA-binding protein [Bacteroidales bacterium]|nr:HU family DNA-binding protein [Bacteroidales bacterium]